MAIAQPDLARPLLNALLANASIVEDLPAFNNTVPIFTRRPPPVGAPYPMILISSDIAKQNKDGYDDLRPLITRDVAVYGLNNQGGDSSSDHYRLVEDLALRVFALFHRDHMVLVPPDGWVLVDIESIGPIPAPADDDMYVGRIVTLHVQLAHSHLTPA